MARAFEKYVSAPQETGKVMVIEKEFGPDGAADWARMASGIVDIVKCTFGTGALYDEDILKAKCKVYTDAGMSPMVGGTLTEVAALCMGGYSKSHLKDYFDYAKSLGFTHAEFSDGTIYIPDNARAEVIEMIRDAGLTVISEVGKKDPKKDAMITTEKRIELMKQDMDSGSSMVIIEAREGGKGIGVMDKDGKVKYDELDKLINTAGIENTMIETPDKGQQQGVFMRYGPKVSVGNVQPRDVLSAAALRGGLRGDTISSLRKEDWAKYHEAVGAPSEYNL
jgi:phosphosulfolactate synthase